MKEWLDKLQVGDPVIRWMGGKIAMQLTVTARTPNFIMCDEYTFHPRTGIEIDDVIGVDGTGTIISFISPHADLYEAFVAMATVFTDYLRERQARRREGDEIIDKTLGNG